MGENELKKLRFIKKLLILHLIKCDATLEDVSKTLDISTRTIQRMFPKLDLRKIKKYKKLKEMKKSKKK